VVLRHAGCPIGKPSAGTLMLLVSEVIASESALETCWLESGRTPTFYRHFAAIRVMSSCCSSSLTGSVRSGNRDTAGHVIRRVGQCAEAKLAHIELQALFYVANEHRKTMNSQMGAVLFEPPLQKSQRRAARGTRLRGDSEFARVPCA
jgi:hypothetical protein